ncbi:MAG: hypothetical protein Q9Q40_13990 [Acidobacteriota bacterium]|nr:hypothetical protein [Acidobacteriota bacterium]MDQ7086920.1 hypothetical protein [Acidobacteriota bacterium]
MLSFWYQEIVGGAIFVLGLALAWRGGELGLNRAGRGRLAVLLGGLLALAALQGAFEWAAAR